MFRPQKANVQMASDMAHCRNVFLVDVGVMHLGRRWAYFTTIVLPAIGRSPKRPIEISWKPGVRPAGTMMLIW